MQKTYTYMYMVCVVYKELRILPYLYGVGDAMECQCEIAHIILTSPQSDNEMRIDW